MTDRKPEELELVIGPRGAVRVTSKNRGIVQKWLTANGVQGVVAKKCTVMMLEIAYNDTANIALDKLLATVIPEPEPKAQPVTDDPHAPPEPKLAGKDMKAELTKALAAAIAQINIGTGITEEDIRSLIKSEIKTLAPREIHIRINDNEPFPLPGGDYHRQFETVLKAVMCGNVALIGPAGSGKTTLAEQVARALGIEFYFTGAISSEYKLTGFVDAQGRVTSTAFRRAYETGGLFLFDEIDASLPAAVLAFNAALANGHADFPDGAIRRHEKFFCMAAANTYWTGADRVYVGRNQLDGATLDRFIMIDFEYDEELEKKLASNADWVSYVQKVRKAARDQKTRHVVSPRASIMGSRLLEQGISRADVEHMVLFKGLDKDAVTKLRAAA